LLGALADVSTKRRDYCPGILNAAVDVAIPPYTFIDAGYNMFYSYS
jgi:hypothetical protein